MKKIRCAIYTRKSSEEGLEQDFNSLDAQHAACSAYVASQASEGWILLKARYDDGGISGGTLERPGLQKLLADIGAGRIDVVVVYKVDRLTRSLLDFARLVEAFDSAGTSFVSVTQSFNTTTSMGRLTLNMLLSFAQFEREVTAERIRDKIAASKQRGMWMGGTPPLGYRPDGRSLDIVDEHADLIRHIFRRYLHLGNVRLVAEELQREDIRTPVRTTVKGNRTFGGALFSRGQIYRILGNPIYIGRIPHGKTSYPGMHPAIIEQGMWDRVQQMLTDNRTGKRSAPVNIRHPSILAGKLFDDRGEALVVTHANKGKVRYRYYVSRQLQHGGDASANPGMRIPAREIEALVIEHVAQTIGDPIRLLKIPAETTVEGQATPAAVTTGPAASGPVGQPDIPALVEKARELATRLRECRSSHDRMLQALIGDIVGRIDIAPSEVRITLDPAGLGNHIGIRIDPTAPALRIAIPARLKRSGLAVRMVLEDGRGPTQTADTSNALMIWPPFHRTPSGCCKLLRSEIAR